MMKINSIKWSLPVWIIALSLYSCGGDENTQEIDQKDQNTVTETESERIVITGNLTNTNSNMVYLYEIQNNKPQVVDSSEINAGDGSFTLTKELNDEIDYAMVSLDRSFPISLYLQSGEAPHITSNASNLKNYSVEGSVHSNIAQGFLTEMFNFQDSRSKWVKASQELPFDAQKERQKYLDSVSIAKSRLENTAKSFIDENFNSPSAIMALGSLYPQGGLENFDTTLLGYFDKVEKGLGENFPGSAFHAQISQDIKMIRSQLVQLNRPKPEAGDIVLSDPNGETRALSDLRGKVVLVDFWASWCGPCRRENPNIVRLYNQYKDKGFAIYSVSLDGLPQQRNPKEEWIQAIQQDGLVWPDHVSDLKGWQSSIVSDFGVNSIPFTLLIDKDGSVIGEGLRGPQLEQKLKEILG